MCTKKQWKRRSTAHIKRLKIYAFIWYAYICRNSLNKPISRSRIGAGSEIWKSPTVKNFLLYNPDYESLKKYGVFLPAGVGTCQGNFDGKTSLALNFALNFASLVETKGEKKHEPTNKTSSRSFKLLGFAPWAHCFFASFCYIFSFQNKKMRVATTVSGANWKAWRSSHLCIDIFSRRARLARPDKPDCLRYIYRSISLSKSIWYYREALSSRASLTSARFLIIFD